MSDCPLTPEERALLEAMLAAAESAYHSLMCGLSARVVVDQNGERVEFNTGNKGNLYAYILHLRSRLGLLNECTGMPSGPARFWF
jgi:hypothetical protein